jgi:8-oxo-dGTP pyrophosphatase MutT (NUDIX family)
VTRTNPPDPTVAERLSRLERRLALPLPGLTAQLAMAPRPRRRSATFDPARAQPAAVLLLIFPAEPNEQTIDGVVRAGDLCLALTKRTDHVASHKNEVCLPGGAVDAGETAVDAALREAHEEIGVVPSEVRILGRLTPLFIPVSGFRLEPFVGAASRCRADGRRARRCAARSRATSPQRGFGRGGSGSILCA